MCRCNASKKERTKKERNKERNKVIKKERSLIMCCTTNMRLSGKKNQSMIRLDLIRLN